MRKLLGELLSKLLRKLLRKLWAFSKGLKISKDNKHRSKSVGQSLKKALTGDAESLLCDQKCKRNAALDHGNGPVLP